MAKHSFISHAWQDFWYFSTMTEFKDRRKTHFGAEEKRIVPLIRDSSHKLDVIVTFRQRWMIVTIRRSVPKNSKSLGDCRSPALQPVLFTLFAYPIDSIIFFTIDKIAKSIWIKKESVSATGGIEFCRHNLSWKKGEEWRTLKRNNPTVTHAGSFTGQTYYYCWSQNLAHIYGC